MFSSIILEERGGEKKKKDCVCIKFKNKETSHILELSLLSTSFLNELTAFRYRSTRMVVCFPNSVGTLLCVVRTLRERIALFFRNLITRPRKCKSSRGANQAS